MCDDDDDDDGVGGVTMEEPRITKSLILAWPTVLFVWVRSGKMGGIGLITSRHGWIGLDLKGGCYRWGFCPFGTLSYPQTAPLCTAIVLLLLLHQGYFALLLFIYLFIFFHNITTVFVLLLSRTWLI